VGVVFVVPIILLCEMGELMGQKLVEHGGSVDEE
jgi:hypothetical protein